MAMTPITDHVDNDIAFELFAIIECQPGYKNDGFRVISIDMKDRCLDHLCDISTVRGRTCIHRVAGGKTYLIIMNKMNGTTGVEASG
ncbi:hypothetical protein BMS3Bbin11_01690 [bacterium BMS3Bbin11]|nr:hypothetical protein BMS3Bbin11_01690 [bacterium BMS3Bbin11]